MFKLALEKINEYCWEVPRQGAMRVPARVFASAKMLEKIQSDQALKQLANVATLPGIVEASLAMPDVHWGYGFPVGGVAATDAEAGVISPGGIGFDISCGVRLVRSALTAKEVEPYLPQLVDKLFEMVPSGVGATGPLHLNNDKLKRVFEGGAQWAVREGYGLPEDLLTIEDSGRIAGSDPDLPSERARERGRDQLGTLGSGNHFLEIERVDAIYDEVAASAFGLFKGQMVALIHTGSRGCGYQVCDDYLKLMPRTSALAGYRPPDRQLACAPLVSREGRDYLAAMAAAANFARANRQVITHRTREAFEAVLGRTSSQMGLGVVYDVCHNIAKIEEYVVSGKKRRLCVHRKGATRAFPAGHEEVPERYRSVGQPVIIPGSMGTASYVLVGTQDAMSQSFGTVAHGAGREMSRIQAAKKIKGEALALELKSQGIHVRTPSYRGLAEEAPFAYKDVNEVVEVCERSGLSRKVARMSPMGVIKG
ncbi:MAG: RtcB family protein [Elusimicrobia bacterium]|nr:RtcB family protein [Elusimicrobiota bacterium]